MEGNAKALYPHVKGKKKIYAKELPHNILTQLWMCYHIFTSRLIVTDDYVKYLRYFLLDETQRVVQLWHACGAFKKFGRREQKREAFDGAAHAQYNIVSVSSEKVRSIYADAFQIDLSRVRALGVPRTDQFFDKDFIRGTKERIYQAYPEFRNKKVLVYAPTFRGGGGSLTEKHFILNWILSGCLKSFRKTRYLLFVRIH